MARKHKKGGADTWANWAREKVGLQSQQPVVSQVVEEVTAPLQTAGKRLKKHLGVNPMSSKDARKLLRTAKGDRMLGGKRRGGTRRRRS